MVEAAKKDGPSSYPGRIALFRSAERTVTGENCLDLGWSEIAAGGVDVYQVPGLHHALLRKNASEISRGLKESLARTRQAAHSLN